MKIALAGPVVNGRKDFEAQSPDRVGTPNGLELGGRNIWPRRLTFSLIMKVLMSLLSLLLPWLLISRFFNCLVMRK